MVFFVENSLTELIFYNLDGLSGVWKRLLVDNDEFNESDVSLLMTFLLIKLLRSINVNVLWKLIICRIELMSVPLLNVYSHRYRSS